MDLFYLAGSALMGIVVGGPVGLVAGVVLFMIVQRFFNSSSEEAE